MASQATRQKAQFIGGGAPPGGFCLSSFVVVSRGNDVLVGKMKMPEVWVERFFVGQEFAPKYLSSGKYLMPASHLSWYESPLDAASRIMSEQLLLDYPKDKLKLLDVQSHLRGDIGDEHNPPHWDLCFVYGAQLTPRQSRNLATPDWFEDYRFKKRSELTTDDFTRGHGDVLEEAGVIGEKSRQKNRRRVARKTRDRRGTR
ncbi:MAG TPA: hypothetical protein VFF30_04355 [Nitrososphaerales archaeon]|nr:hypothetical protein [Nitrososphaerales archaeon]